MRLLQAVKGLGRFRVGSFVGMDEEGFAAVHLLYVGFGYTRGKIEYGIRVQLEDGENAVDFTILGSC